MIATLATLAALFGGLSLLAFGGGNAVVASMQRAAVANHWTTGAQFLDLFALSRASPGPGSLIAALVGQQAAGLAGALVASVSMFAPSSTLVAIAAGIWRRHERSRLRFRIERALIPVAIGLTVGSALAIARRNESEAVLWAVTAVSTVVLTWRKPNPLGVLLLGGLASVALL